jgi:membrane protein implicated in regulation of membrane protease activity
MDGVTNTAMTFPDTWMWLIFISIGLFLILLELIIGVATGLDLVFLGTAFIIGGLVTWPIHSWVWTLVVSLVICIIYVVLGRRYIHRWTTTKKEKTNIDTIIGQKGVALQQLTPGTYGLVKVGNEEWRAISREAVGKGETITVIAITGVTLSVEKDKGDK